MNGLQQTIRLHIYHHLVERGRAPQVRETAEALSLPFSQVEAVYRELADAHVIVLLPDSLDLWMAMPFSSVPTDFRVTAGARSWWANCAWDAFGIPALLHADAEISTHCADCGEALSLSVKASALAESEGVIHFAIPAARWWEDVGFT